MPAPRHSANAMSGSSTSQNQIQPTAPALRSSVCAQRLGLAGELLQRVLAAPERLEHADAVDALFDGGREVAGLVLALARERAVASSRSGSPRTRAGRRSSRKIVPSSQCQRKSSAEPTTIVMTLTTSSTMPKAIQRRSMLMSCIMRLSS